MWRTYSATLIGALGGNASYGTGINASGQVSGWSYTTGTTAAHAWLFDGSTLVDLTTFGGSQSFAHNLNDRGEIVGVFYPSGSNALHAYVLSNGTSRDLHPAGAVSSNALGINASGQVVGTYTDAGGVRHAVLYTNTGVNDLGSFGGTLAPAWSINTIRPVGW